MKHSTRNWKRHCRANKDKPYLIVDDMTVYGVVTNLYRQKEIVNNSKKYKAYTDEERRLILKGLDIAIQRAWNTIFIKEVY